MTVDINAIEAIWICLNFITLILTAVALLDALKDAAAVKALNGKARELVAGGNVRREALRLVVQVVLIAVALPGLFEGRDTPLSVSVVLLVSVPALLLIQTALDTRERWKLSGILTERIIAERDKTAKDIDDRLTAHEHLPVNPEAGEAAHLDGDHG